MHAHDLKYAQRTEIYDPPLELSGITVDPYLTVGREYVILDEQIVKSDSNRFDVRYLIEDDKGLSRRFSCYYFRQPQQVRQTTTWRDDEGVLQERVEYVDQILDGAGPEEDFGAFDKRQDRLDQRFIALFKGGASFCETGKADEQKAETREEEEGSGEEVEADGSESQEMDS